MWPAEMQATFLGHSHDDEVGYARSLVGAGLPYGYIIIIHMSFISFYLLNISKIAAKLLKNYEMAKDFSLSIIKVIKI